uniref:Uncharacterized protein n=1 Tax=Nomascus leucogenys TaxID=61853 RepID=A0A2I3HPY4_NOMLE
THRSQGYLVQGAAWVGHVSTLNHHAFDQDLVFREVLPSRVAFTVAAFNLENRWSDQGWLKMMVKPTRANSPGIRR